MPVQVWKFYNGRGPAALGYIPDFISENDPRPIREQFKSNYIGGWNPFKGFKPNSDFSKLNYPGDPPTLLLAETTIRDERICVYQHSWVAIIQLASGSYEIARMD